MTKRTSYASPQGKITLTLESWETNCGDGCCYDYGLDLYCNGKNLDIDLQYASLGHVIKDVIKRVGLTSKGDNTVSIDFFSQTYDFKTENAMNELLKNFSRFEEMKEYDTLWDYFNPNVEFFFLGLHCKELDREKTVEQNDKFAIDLTEYYLQELIIINGHILPVIGNEDDDEFEIFDKLVEVLEILGFEVNTENDW